MLRLRRLSRVVALLSLLPSPVLGQGIHYEHPGTAEVVVHTELVPGSGLEADFFRSPEGGAEDRPAVVFVFGYPDDALDLGPLRQLDQFRAWARLVAAEGMVGVLYSTTDPQADLVSLMQFLAEQGNALGVDARRIALWSASANGPLALWYARTAHLTPIRALVAYYAYMPTPDGYLATELTASSEQNGFVLPPYLPEHEYSHDVPLFVVRAGRDRPGLLALLDRFVGYGEQLNLPLQVRRYPDGQHSFDSRDDSRETRAVIEETLAFLSQALNVN